MNRRHAILAFMLAVGAVKSAVADSLWDRRKPRRVHMFQDSRARRVGDLLTVVVSESTTVRSSEDKSLSKTNNTNGNFGVDASSSGGLGTHAAGAAFDGSQNSSRSFDGEAAYADSRTFSDRLTVTVTDVLPNGNMHIMGKRCVSIAGEQKTLIITGVVRPLDIRTDNSVSSQLIADLKTTYHGKGDSQKFTRQGWFSRAVNKVWPF